MSLPKVKFVKLDIEENIDTLVWYAKPENSKNGPLNYYKLLVKLFPELEGKIKENMNDNEVYSILNKEIRPILENLSINSDDHLKFQKVWDKVNDDVMMDLENRLKIEWNCDEIKCRIGLLPVCPRDILGKTFDINYGIKCEKVIAIAIHELCHFIYFQKWMELFSDYKEEEFDAPHIAWYLSEAMIDPLINNEIFHKYTSDDLSAYTVFYETFIDGKSVIEYLREYVNEYPIEEAIKKGYNLFKKYEKEIKHD